MMISLDGKTFYDLEVLVRQVNINQHSHRNIYVKCDSGISEKCRKLYTTEYRNYFKWSANNKGKIFCIFCSRKLKFSGRSNPNCKYTFDDNFFKQIDSNEKAYLLGWIGSDGCITKRGFTVSINRRDIKCLTIIKNIICTKIPIVKFETENENSISKMAKFSINSQEISKDLCKIFSINPGKKSDTINFPINLEQKFLWNFLRGYFDGDGCITNVSNKVIPKITYTSQSNKILNGIKTFTHFPFLHYSYENINRIELQSYEAIKFLDALYKNSKNLKLERKFKLYKFWKNKFGS